MPFFKIVFSDTSGQQAFPFRNQKGKIAHWKNFTQLCNCFITTDAYQPWTDSCDCYFAYLIIHFDYSFPLFDYTAKYNKFLFAVET